MKRAAMMLAVLMICAISGHGQGFINLNFESGFEVGTNFPGNPGNGTLVSVTACLPGWTAYSGPPAGGDVLSEITYISNVFTGFTTSVELESGTLALNGSDLAVGLYPDGFISQTGLVPDGAESLQFEASSDINLYVTIGGQSLAYSAISEGPNYNVYGANIPAGLDGQVETLTFGIDGIGETRLDDIVFSTPEPSECALIGLGAILFGLWRRKLKPQRAQRSQKS